MTAAHSEDDDNRTDSMSVCAVASGANTPPTRSMSKEYAASTAEEEEYEEYKELSTKFEIKSDLEDSSSDDELMDYFKQELDQSN